MFPRPVGDMPSQSHSFSGVIFRPYSTSWVWVGGILWSPTLFGPLTGHNLLNRVREDTQRHDNTLFFRPSSVSFRQVDQHASDADSSVGTFQNCQGFLTDSWYKEGRAHHHDDRWKEILLQHEFIVVTSLRFVSDTGPVQHEKVISMPRGFKFMEIATKS